MKTMTMYDATPGGVSSVPRDAKCVAGYVDGAFISFPSFVRRYFPRAHCISIGIFLGHLAAFSDIEPGNPIDTPRKVRADFEYRKAHGVWKPGFYCDDTRLKETVIPGLSGIPRSEYRLWLAEWTNEPHIPHGFEACQYTDNRHNGVEGAYDTSLINVDTFFHPSYSPKPKPLPIHGKVIGATGVAGLITVIEGVLHSIGLIHLTPAEYSAITTFAAAIGGWTVPSNWRHR